MQRLALIGVAIQLLQQLCGMNVFMFYGPKVFEKLSFEKSSDAFAGLQGEGELAAAGDDTTSGAAFTFTALTGVVNFLSTFPGIMLVDRCPLHVACR